MKKTREYSFDILRAISMVMVIIIHVSNVYCRKYGLISSNSYVFSLIFNTISRVSVPIFFMISGALLLNRNFDKSKYINRIIKFIILIVAWDIIYLIWEYLYLGIKYDKLYMLLVSPYRAHLWFLYTIIILYLIQPILKYILNKANNLIKIGLFILWFIFSTLSMYNYTIAQTFTIFCYTGYFVIGYYLYNYIKNQKLNKYNLIAILMLLISYSASIYLNYKSTLQFNMFYNNFFAYRAPYIILCSFVLFTLIYNWFHSSKPHNIIMFFSDISLGVYLIHGIFLDITTKIFDYTKINALIGVPLFTIIIFICSIISVYILRKSKILSKIL